MSWFGDRLQSIELGEPGEIEESSPNEEVADGVVVERRKLLWVSAGTAAAFLLGPQRAAHAQSRVANPREGSTSTLEEFLEELLPMARELVASSERNESAYLHRVASMMAKLKDPAADVRSTMRAFREKHREEDEPRFPLGVMQLSLKPGASLPHHDHRNYNGVIVGVEGEIRIRNYDILDPEVAKAEDKTFRIRETQDTLVRPGQYSMLASETNNIHDLKGGDEGGRVLDVFTFFERGARSFYLDVEGEARDAEKRIFDASWRPQRRRRRQKKD